MIPPNLPVVCCDFCNRPFAFWNTQHRSWGLRGISASFGGTGPINQRGPNFCHECGKGFEEKQRKRMDIMASNPCGLMVPVPSK